MKISLFDRIFKPKKIQLPNGHYVFKPFSRIPFILIALLVVVIISAKMTNFQFSVLINRFNQFTVILNKIFHPNMKYFSKVINPLIETIQMSVAGTIVGCLIGLPLAILASSNINKNRPTLLLFRFFLSVLRSVPSLIYASIFALVFSLGTLAGTVAIIVFTVGIVAKMLYESIETIDMGPYEAMLSFGATSFKAFWTACIPQILPTYLDDCLYCFELNVRASAILGYVGAGGLGILIRERTGFRAYSDLGMILLSVFIVVWLIDFVNNMIRKKLS